MGEPVCPSVVVRFDARTRLRLTAHLGDAIVAVTTPGWPPVPVALVDWRTGFVRCAFEEAFATPLGELSETLSDEAVELYASFPGGMATVPLQPEAPPATLELRGVVLSFRCDLETARVTVTAEDRHRPYVGGVRGAGGDTSATQFRLHPSWLEVFGDARGRTIIRRCAIRRWRVEDKRRRQALSPVGAEAGGAVS
jgi:hypothetical protein